MWMSARTAKLSSPDPTVSIETQTFASIPYDSLIGTAAFLCATTQCFRIYLSDPSLHAKSSQLASETPDLSNISKEYKGYADHCETRSV